MKIENVDNIIVVYIFNDNIDIDNVSDLNNKIKNIFIKIMKRGNFDFFGYSKVNVYHNKHYGIILEVQKIYDCNLNNRTIDLKIVVYKNVPMYLEFDEYYDFPNCKLMLINNKYYLEINDDIDINKYIEYGRIKYKKLLNEID